VAGFAGGGSGSLSGPFWPQAGSAARQAIARAARRARIIGRIMTESEFHGAVDAVLARIEASLEDEADLDIDLENAILTITCADDSKVIVNRQTPNREIWVAARSGGFHFTLREGVWRDTRSGDELFASLSRILASQAGVQARWK
jgi:CyaY protein